MTTDRELMQQALDALEVEHSAIYGTSQTAKAIEALRARLAQPEQEPVVKWDASAPLVMNPHPAFQATQPQQHSEQWWKHKVSNAWAEGYEKGRVFCGCGDQIMPNDNAECGNCVTARNAAKPDLAQVGEVGVWGEREWQGLTDEEYRTLLQQADQAAAKTGSVFQNLRHAIEAKLKEKNT